MRRFRNGKCASMSCCICFHKNKLLPKTYRHSRITYIGVNNRRRACDGTSMGCCPYGQTGSHDADIGEQRESYETSCLAVNTSLLCPITPLQRLLSHSPFQWRWTNHLFGLAPDRPSFN